MNRYRDLFEHATIGIALCDARHNRFELVNPAFARIHGYEAEELIGVSPENVLCPDSSCGRDQCDAYFSVCDNAVFETVHIKKDGTPVDVEVYIAVIKDQGGNIRYRIANLTDISQRKEIEKKIDFMAHHDYLTGLPNRILLQDRVDHAVAHALRNGSKVALVSIDLDGFKTINDSLGHSVGDEMLKDVALRLRECLRKTDTISRQGGDEFVLVLPDVSDAKAVVIPIVKKILDVFKTPFAIEKRLLSTSVSMGIALAPDDGETFELLLQKADTAMYRAKELGRNTYCFYTDRMNRDMLEQLKMQSELARAVEKRDFLLYYQPQIDLREKRITGVEALVRWNHPESGIISPATFIPLAEASGLIVPIGEWVIQEACTKAAHWLRNGMPLSIAVNISAIQFKRGDLVSVVEKSLAQTGLPARYLELELTESTMMHDTENTLKTVCRLKEIGVRLSIDDFGTGYSSLAYLKRFDVDKLKIDQSFVRDICQDHEDAVIVKTIIQMAKSLNLKTVAEGVESDEILKVLETHGCDEVQGYYFAKPMKFDEFERYYDGGIGRIAPKFD